jgi:hypothetical protein
MQQLERALLDLSERAEPLPPDVLISRVEARLVSEGLLPIAEETVPEPPRAQKRSASQPVSARLQRARAFASAAIITLVVVGIAALVVRGGNAPIADEPAPPATVTEPPTVSEAPTAAETPLIASEVLLISVAGPTAPAAITPAGPGDIWVGAADGIWRFSEEETGKEGVGAVADLTITPDGTVWAAFWLGNTVSLAMLEGETWVDYPQPQGYLGNMATDRDGTLWWAGNSGLHRLDGSEWVSVDEALPEAFASGQGNTLEVRVEAAADGTLWVGSWWGMVPESGGLTRFNGIEWEEIPLPGGEPTPVYNLAVAPNGDLWVVLVEHVSRDVDEWSLARLVGDTWTVFTGADGMPQDFVYSMAADPDGVVWLTQQHFSDDGSAPQGIVAFDGEQWTSLLEGENVRDVAVEADGTVWLAGDRLYRLDP